MVVVRLSDEVLTFLLVLQEDSSKKRPILDMSKASARQKEQTSIYIYIYMYIYNNCCSVFLCVAMNVGHLYKKMVLRERFANSL